MMGSCGILAVAGCLGGPQETNGVLKYDDHEVPLVSTATAAEWYDGDDAVFFDARSREPYEAVHIDGAYWSPQPNGRDEDDPSEELSMDTRIVTYCRCPHSKAGARAVGLLSAGFEDVHALDEGLDDWVDAGHPVAGEEVTDQLSSGDLGTPAYREP